MNETALIAPTIKGRTIKTMEKMGFLQKLSLIMMLVMMMLNIYKYYFVITVHSVKISIHFAYWLTFAIHFDSFITLLTLAITTGGFFNELNEYFANND